MASGIIGNDVPRKGLRVRPPCPPLEWQMPCCDTKRHESQNLGAHDVFLLSELLSKR